MSWSKIRKWLLKHNIDISGMKKEKDYQAAMIKF